MIIVKGRELLIPENERYIGTTYDDNSTVRTFRIPRFHEDGMDKSQLDFYVIINYDDGSDPDAVGVVKAVNDDYIVLEWDVGEDITEHSGCLYLWVRGFDHTGTVRWSSFPGVFYIETSGTEPSDLSDLEERISEEDKLIRLAKLYKSQPMTAATAAEMIDREQIYVYVGDEEGYQYGYWYFWDGSAWVPGGVYNSIGLQTDKELIAEDVAADAKAVGDELTDLKNAVNDHLGVHDAEIDALQLESGMMDNAVVEGKNILITGDSISFNNYGFGTAYQSTMDDCYPGIMSWSNMLRMTLLRQCFNFVPARELSWYSNFAVKNGSNLSDKYHYDFNGDYLFINHGQGTVGVNNAPTFSFQPSVRGTGWYLVYANTTVNAEKCDFTVYIDDTAVGTYENYSDTTHQGNATRFALINGEITATSKVKIVLSGTSGGGSLRLYGLINVHPNFVWTGVGGRKTAVMVEDYQNIIGQYAADTTLMILAAGTNDLNYDTMSAESSAANIRTLLSNAITDGISDIIVLGPAYLASTADSRIQAFDYAYREECNDLGVTYLSVYEILRHRKSGWQTSGPHFLRGANNSVYAAFCKHFDTHPIYSARLYRLASKSYLTSDIEYQIRCVNGVASVIDAKTGNAVTDLDYSVVFSGTNPSNKLATITISCAGIPSIDLLSLSGGISVFVGSYATVNNRKLTLVLGATDSSGTRVDMTGISFYINVHSHSTYAEHTEHFYAIP